MPTPQVVYSVNVRLGGGGMGNSIEEMLRGLYEARLLKQVIVSSCKTTALPAHLITAQGFLGRVQKRLGFYDRSGWLDYLFARVFDRWANRVMQPAEIFESWTFCCLTCLQTAKKRGSRTFLGLGSAHPRAYLELINAERLKWGLAPLPEMPWVRQVERELALADTIIIQSCFSERTLVEHGIPAEKLVRIPLGVDVKRFHPAESRPPGPFRVLFLGQIMLRKGVQYLLEAWKQLGWRDAELWLVGKGMADAQPVLKHYAGLSGLRLMGYVPDQLAAFQACDVFVVPSVEDGFGLVVTEAMACGLPVVVSDHTGAADLVQDGENGFVVAYNDAAGYARVLETLRANPELARKMGRAAQGAARQVTWAAYREKLVELHFR